MIQVVKMLLKLLVLWCVLIFMVGVIECQSQQEYNTQHDDQAQIYTSSGPDANAQLSHQTHVAARSFNFTPMNTVIYGIISIISEIHLFLSELFNYVFFFV